MVAFSNLHILTVKHGEAYVHHFWFLFFTLFVIFGAASSSHRCHR